MVKNNRLEDKVKKFCGKKLWLAPLAGYTDRVFRSICKKHGADVVISEMISSNALIYDNKKTLKLAEFSDRERPIGLQIFGADAEIVAKGIKKILDFDPDFIDINMGCPMKKIVKTGAGSALLKDTEKLKQIIHASKNVLQNKLPLFVKIRSGWDSSDNIEKTAEIIQKSGADALTIHARTRNQLFAGKSNWDIIKRVKQTVSIPVIGNGDITSPEDALRMYETTGCDSIMIGRGAIGKPWLFKQIKQFLQECTYDKISPKRRIVLLQQHFYELCIHYGDEHALRLIRKYISGYTKGLRGARKLRGNLNECNIKEEFNEMIANYLPNI